METVLSYFSQLVDNETLPVLELIQREFLTSVGEPWFILYSKMAAGLAAIIFGCRASFLTLEHARSFQPWKVKPLQESLKPAFFLTASRGQLHWLPKRSRIVCKPSEKMTLNTSSLNYYVSKQIHNEFMVSVTSLKSSSTQHHVRDVNYCPILIKISNKKGYTLEHGYLVIDKSLLCPRFLGQIYSTQAPPSHSDC